MTDKPVYRDRYACAHCGTGYLDCAAAAAHGLMCCKGCDNHPERWTTDPAYTADEIADMRRRTP